MTLEEAISKTECDVLRGRLIQFLSDTRENLLRGTACPVCSTDIRQTYQPSPKNPWRGNCAVCKLGLQVRHRIEHPEHIHPDGTLCACEVNMPSSLLRLDLCVPLKEAWDRMELPRRPLTDTELAAWLSEVQRVHSTVIHNAPSTHSKRGN